MWMSEMKLLPGILQSTMRKIKCRSITRLQGRSQGVCQRCMCTPLFKKKLFPFYLNDYQIIDKVNTITAVVRGGGVPQVHVHPPLGLKRPPDPSPNNFAPPISNSWLRPCWWQKIPNYFLNTIWSLLWVASGTPRASLYNVMLLPRWYSIALTIKG